MDIEIDKYRFYTETLESETSDNRRNVNRTPIMNGGEYVSFGHELPMIWKFKTHLNVERNLQIINMIRNLQNKIVHVSCPQIGKGFNATCEIKRNIEPNIKNTIVLDFVLTEANSYHNNPKLLKVDKVFKWSGRW